MYESDSKKKDKGKSIFDSKGPMQIGSSGTGESHLHKQGGRPGYTTGVPYEEDKYVSPVIGEDYQVPTHEPSSVRSGATVAHMGVPGEEPVDGSAFPEITTSPTAPIYSTPSRPPIFQGRWRPDIHPSAKIDPAADIRGHILIKGKVHIAAGTIISAHDDEPICLGEGCAVFEGAVLTILPVRVNGVKISSRLVKVEGAEYPLYIGEDTVIAPRAQITGPCYIGNNCLIGCGAHLFWAKVGAGSIIEPGAFVMNVEIPPDHFVPSGLRVTTRDSVGKLPRISDKYRFKSLAAEMLAEIRSRA
jgi:carbonic anhydrase/acetyltransferase-like protein (isoleucine patch superfamily)